MLYGNTIHALIKFTGEVLDMDASFQSHVICRQIFCNLLKINPWDIPNGIMQNCSISGFWIKDLRIQRSQILTKNWKKSLGELRNKMSLVYQPLLHGTTN